MSHLGTLILKPFLTHPMLTILRIIELPKQYKSIELEVDGLSIEELPYYTKDQLTILKWQT